MRRGLIQAQHLAKERQRLRMACRKDPQNDRLREQLDTCTDRILDLLVEELTHQQRDIVPLQNAARRRW